jgi:hypothetical protein
MTDIPLLCPVEPHEMDKRMRRGFNDIVARVTVAAAGHGWGNDFLLRLYTAGIFHGIELQKRAASADTLPKGQDAQHGLAGTEGGAVDAEGSETPNG